MNCTLYVSVNPKAHVLFTLRSCLEPVWRLCEETAGPGLWLGVSGGLCCRPASGGRPGTDSSTHSDT